MVMGRSIQETPKINVTSTKNSFAVLDTEDEDKTETSQSGDVVPPPAETTEDRKQSRNERRNGVRNDKVSPNMYFQGSQCAGNDSCNHCRDDGRAM